MTQRSQPLDLLRTLAIFLVFASHFHQFAVDFWFGRVGDFGWVGVDLFFVLSGYLISNQLLQEIQKTGSLSLKNFYLRRGLRIWPNYLVVLLLYACIPAFAERSQLAPIWRYLTFTLNFGLDYATAGAFSHAWSLSVEEQFYLVLPPVLIALVPRIDIKKSVSLFLVLLLLGIGVRNHEWHRWIENIFVEKHREMYRLYYGKIYYPTYCRMDSLSAGVAIAALIHFRNREWAWLSKYGNRLLAIGLLLIFTACVISQDEYGLIASLFTYPLNAFGFGFLLMAALSNGGLLAKFRGRWASRSADLAFSFYLVHKSLIHLCKNGLNQWGLDPGSILYPVVILGVCTLGSLLLYFLVETPCLHYRDRLLHSKSLHFPNS